MSSVLFSGRYDCFLLVCFLFSSRRRHTRCALVTGVQTCALPICSTVQPVYSGEVALSAGNSRIDAEGRVDKVIAIDARLSPLHLDDLLPDAAEIGRASCRERVCPYV